VAHTSSLQEQLQQALDANSNLTRLYKSLDERLDEAYTALAGARMPAPALAEAFSV
jgi:hypothetical protein